MSNLPTSESGLFNPRHFKLAAAFVAIFLLWVFLMAVLFAISNRIQVESQKRKETNAALLQTLSLVRSGDAAIERSLPAMLAPLCCRGTACG